MTSTVPPKKRVTFKLYAPEAKEVFVAGTFNDWDPNGRSLKRDQKGNWKTWTSLPGGTYEYLFVIDGEWQEDPNCHDRCPNPYGDHNSVVQL